MCVPARRLRESRRSRTKMRARYEACRIRASEPITAYAGSTTAGGRVSQQAAPSISARARSGSRSTLVEWRASRSGNDWRRPARLRIRNGGNRRAGGIEVTGALALRRPRTSRRSGHARKRYRAGSAADRPHSARITVEARRQRDEDCWPGAARGRAAHGEPSASSSEGDRKQIAVCRAIIPRAFVGEQRVRSSRAPRRKFPPRTR